MKTVSKEYDPIAMGPVRAKPEGFTPWMKLVINHGPEGTLRELIDWLAKEQNAEVKLSMYLSYIHHLNEHVMLLFRSSSLAWWDCKVHPCHWLWAFLCVAYPQNDSYLICMYRLKPPRSTVVVSLSMLMPFGG